MEKQSYLDGMKGLACIGVFIYHFYTSFCKQVFRVKFDSTSMDIILGNICKPIIDGPLLVLLFALISGWLVAQTKIDGITKLVKRSLLRYTRFMLPSIPIVFGTWLLSMSGFFYTGKAFTTLGVLDNVYNTDQITFGGDRLKTRIDERSIAIRSPHPQKRV